MKTTFDAVDVIWVRLNETLADKISGGVYKYKRPFNSKDEDIVINSLPISPGIPQECAINVNCYVPDLRTKVKGVSNMDMPDTLRLSTLAGWIVDILNDRANEEYYYFVTGQNTLSNEAGNEHYVNIRLDFLFIES